MVLIKFLEDGEERNIPIDKDSLIIGRSNACDLSISSDTISRQHARLENRNNTYHIVDLGSRNGVYLNDNKVKESEIKNGDIIKLGAFEFTFIDPSEMTDDSNKTIQQEQRTIMLDNPLEDFIQKDIPLSEETFIERPSKDSKREDTDSSRTTQNKNEPSLQFKESKPKPQDTRETPPSRDIFPSLLMFYDDKAFMTTIRKQSNIIGSSGDADIPINKENFPELAAIIKKDGPNYFLTDEYQTDAILYNNKPIIFTKLYDKMIFSINDITFQFISNKKGISALLEKFGIIFRFFIEKPLLGLLFLFFFIIMIVLLIVILMI